MLTWGYVEGIHSEPSRLELLKESQRKQFSFQYRCDRCSDVEIKDRRSKSFEELLSERLTFSIDNLS